MHLITLLSALALTLGATVHANPMTTFHLHADPNALALSFGVYSDTTCSESSLIAVMNQTNTQAGHSGCTDLSSFNVADPVASFQVLDRGISCYSNFFTGTYCSGTQISSPATGACVTSGAASFIAVCDG